MPTFFDHDDAGPHFSEFPRCDCGVALAGQEERFFFVNHE